MFVVVHQPRHQESGDSDDRGRDPEERIREHASALMKPYVTSHKKPSLRRVPPKMPMRSVAVMPMDDFQLLMIMLGALAVVPFIVIALYGSFR